MNKNEHRNRRIAAIHLIAKKNGITDDDRRAIQQRVTGRTSCANMSVAELGLVLDDLNRGAKPRLVLINSRADSSINKMRGKITAQCNALGVQFSYADGIARHMFKLQVSKCDNKQLRAIIAALTNKQIKQSKCA